MITKKFFNLLGLLIVMAMVMAACAPAATPTAAPAAPAATTAPAAPAAPAVKGPLAAKDITIAGVVFQDDQFMNSMVKGYQDAGTKLGVKVVTANTNNDQAKETELIQTYMSQGVSGIAIAPLSKDASIATLKQANDKGIKVAITNMSISDTSFLAGGYTSDDKTNSTLVGAEAVKFIKANIKGDVNAAVIDFDDQLPDQSKARWGGFLDALKAGGVAYNLVAHQSAHAQDTALSATTDMLTAHPEINVIWASNEGGTIGATQAVKQAGKAGKVFVWGYDGSDQLTSMILDPDNILQGAVAQDPYTMGYNAVTALVNVLEGNPGPDAGKMTVVNGIYLGRSNPDGVNTWRKANGLKEITVAAAPAAPAAGAMTFVLVPKNLGNPYFDTANTGAQKAAKELGVTVTYTGPATADATQQIQLINSLIAQKVSGLAISADDSDALVPTGKDAIAAGIPVVSWDSAIGNDGRTLHINQAENQGIADIEIKMALDLTGPAGGKIAILSATSTAPNQNAWIELMKADLKKPENAKLNLVTVVYGDDDDTKSYNEAQALFKKYPDLKVIIAPTTVGIAAAGRAVTDAKLIGKVFVTGLGTPNQMRDYVKSGAAPEFALWNPADLGYLAIYTLDALATGKIKGVEGDKFTAGTLGDFTVKSDPKMGLNVLLGQPFVWNKDNIDNSHW
jgi:rhamnose ABC transporter rhamnose-binding protein